MLMFNFGNYSHATLFFKIIFYKGKRSDILRTQAMNALRKTKSSPPLLLVHSHVTQVIKTISYNENKNGISLLTVTLWTTGLGGLQSSIIMHYWTGVSSLKCYAISDKIHFA